MAVLAIELGSCQHRVVGGQLHTLPPPLESTCFCWAPTASCTHISPPAYIWSVSTCAQGGETKELCSSP